MTKRALDDTELDGLFAAAKAAAPQPSPDLMARILADAEASVAAPPKRRPSFWAGVLESIGGWPSAAGLATAAVAGLAIGLGTPDTLETLSGGYLAAGGYQLEDLMPSYGDLLEEG